MFSLICVEQGFRKRSGHYKCNYWGSLSHYNGINLLQDILNRTSPHKSDSHPAAWLQPVGQNQNGELANAARLKKFCLLHFPCMWCLWFVFCPSFALTQLIKFMVSPSCGCICFIIRRHLCILIHLSILWSTAGRWETFDKLWSVYFEISFKVSKAPFEPLRRCPPQKKWKFHITNMNFY